MVEERRLVADETAPTLCWVHSRDPIPIARLPLRDDLLLIGRALDDGAGISTGDARMSRVHVRILPDRRAGPRKFRIADARSRNGTFVNGSRVESALLEHDDVIRIGDCLFVYRETEPMARARALAAHFSRALPARLLIEGEPISGRRQLAQQIHRDSGGSEPLAEAPAAGGGNVLAPDLDRASPESQARLLSALDAAGRGCLFVTLSEPTRLPAPLYAELARARIELPPLRARKPELLGLLQQLSAAEAQPVSLGLNADAAESLLLWPWPGNFAEVRELFARAGRDHPGRLFDSVALRQSSPAIAHALERRRNPYAARS